MLQTDTQQPRFPSVVLPSHRAVSSFTESAGLDVQWLSGAGSDLKKARAEEASRLSEAAASACLGTAPRRESLWLPHHGDASAL